MYVHNYRHFSDLKTARKKERATTYVLATVLPPSVDTSVVDCYCHPTIVYKCIC